MVLFKTLYSGNMFGMHHRDASYSTADELIMVVDKHHLRLNYYGPRGADDEILSKLVTNQLITILEFDNILKMHKIISVVPKLCALKTNY